VIAALYVLKDGPYAGLPDVEVWDEARDARTYAGPWPVVAHPPCARWGRYWSGGPSAHGRFRLGDDAGCFAAALHAVRQYGGVLEHPEGSHAWHRFCINNPLRAGGWVRAGLTDPGWTCCVYQGEYGHPAQKATWLYAVGTALPALRWGTSGPRLRLDDGYHSTAERRCAIKTGVIHRLSKRQRVETPLAFRDLLLSMARTVAARAGGTDER
jgi:hypothetical protein